MALQTYSLLISYFCIISSKSRTLNSAVITNPDVLSRSNWFTEKNRRRNKSKNKQQLELSCRYYSTSPQWPKKKKGNNKKQKRGTGYPNDGGLCILALSSICAKPCWVDTVHSDEQGTIRFVDSDHTIVLLDDLDG